MYCPSLVHIGDKDTFYSFYPGTERKNKQQQKITLLAVYKNTRRTDVCFVLPVLVCLRVPNSKGITEETQNSVMLYHIIVQRETWNQGEYRQPQQILVQCNAHVTRLKIKI